MLPTLPKIFRPVIQNPFVFLFGLANFIAIAYLLVIQVMCTYITWINQQIKIDAGTARPMVIQCFKNVSTPSCMYCIQSMN